MAPFDRSFTVFEIFYVEEYSDLEIQINCQSPCELVHNLCIREIYRPRAVFLPLLNYLE